MNKLSIVHGNMERTISYALWETFNDETDEVESAKIDDLRGKRLLLVDDNELNCEILEEVLLDQRLFVEKANDGQEALLAITGHDP